MKAIEYGVKVPKGLLLDKLLLKTTWGLMLVKDYSPKRNTLEEMRINILNLDRYLGLSKIRKGLQLLIREVHEIKRY